MIEKSGVTRQRGDASKMKTLEELIESIFTHLNRAAHSRSQAYISQTNTLIQHCTWRFDRKLNQLRYTINTLTYKIEQVEVEGRDNIHFVNKGFDVQGEKVLLFSLSFVDSCAYGVVRPHRQNKFPLIGEFSCPGCFRSLAF